MIFFVELFLEDNRNMRVKFIWGEFHSYATFSGVTNNSIIIGIITYTEIRWRVLDSVIHEHEIISLWIIFIAK